MANFLNQDEFSLLAKDVSEGHATLNVTRSLARQFFMNVGGRNVRDLTGRSVLLQKLTVFGLLLSSVILVLSSLGLLVAKLHWGALIAVPLTGIFWTILAGFTTELGSITSTIAIFVIVVMIAPYTGATYNMSIILFAGSLLSYRLAHMTAQYFLIRLILGSFHAYEMLSDHIVINRHESHAA